MLSTCLLSLLLFFILYCSKHQCNCESIVFQPVFLKDQACAYGTINHEVATYLRCCRPTLWTFFFILLLKKNSLWRCSYCIYTTLFPWIVRRFTFFLATSFWQKVYKLALQSTFNFNRHSVFPERFHCLTFAELWHCVTYDLSLYRTTIGPFRHRIPSCFCDVLYDYTPRHSLIEKLIRWI